MGPEPSIIRSVARFIVGTGRCGSTLLSRMLAECPAVASLDEVLNGLDVARRFQREPIAGPAFAALLTAEQPVLTATLRRGYPVEEVVYPFGRGRFRRGEPMPYLAGACLPRLSDDPDALLDALTDFARGLPAAPAPDQLRRVFDWLAERSGRALWIERSGSSIEYLPALAATFPEARFLHLHRDGRETALSMREHARLPRADLAPLPRAAGGRLRRRVRGIDSAPSRGRATRSRASSPRGRRRSTSVATGATSSCAASPRAKRSRRAAPRAALRGLAAAPREALARIAAFFELPDGAWIARAAALVRGVPPARIRELAPAEAQRLSDACRPGDALLARAAPE